MIGLREEGEGEEEVRSRGKGEDWVEGAGCGGGRFKREGGGLG